MTSKRTKRRRVREELEFLNDVEDNESLDLSTNIESHILMSVDTKYDSVEHITEVVRENNSNNIGNISPEVCIYYTIYYCSIALLLYIYLCK